jgi:hypothetical protein
MGERDRTLRGAAAIAGVADVSPTGMSTVVLGTEAVR